MKKLLSWLRRIWNWIICREWAAIITFISLLVATSAVVVSTRQGRTLELTLLNERYARGVEMLGTNTQFVRLAGINELHSLAEDEPEQYHIRIMRLLSAFVRQPIEDVTKLAPEKVRKDVLEAVTVIATIRKDTDVELDLSGINLAKAFLYNANLARTFLHKANLTGAAMIDSNLTGAAMIDSNLTDAILMGANLTDAKLIGVNLNGAVLTGVDLTGAALTGVDLTGAALFGLDLTGTELLNVTGLTQKQLDVTCGKPENPPKLGGARDAKTGKLLEWHGKECS